MAIELESSGVSPRISFSHDFCQSDILPAVEPNPRRSNSIGIDFDFCVRKSFDQDTSSADELFSDGKILPTQVKKKNNNNNPQVSSTLLIPAAPGINNPEETKEDSLKRSKTVMKEETGDDNDHLEDNNNNNNNNYKQSSKSFWRFKRSSSLNCGSGYGRSLCPLPPLLHRSNSTGSAVNDKRAAVSKDSNNSSQKQASIRSSSSHASSTTHLKPPLKKNYGPYGNAHIHVNPVINVPSGNFFGLGSVFFNGKDKNKKK